MHARPSSIIHHHHHPLLYPSLAILLDVDVLVALERVDGFIGELAAVTSSVGHVLPRYWGVGGDIREAFDEGVLMLDGSALGFGTLLGPARGLASISVFLWVGSHLSSSAGGAPALSVICYDSLSARMQHQAVSGDTDSEHGRHLGWSKG